MSVRLGADDTTLRGAFFKLQTFDDLARLLEVSPRDLRFYLFKAKKYRSFRIGKKTGGERVIHTPANSLKIIQRKLNQVLHAVYGSRSPVYGFVRGRSIRSNARRHIGSKFLLNFDLADFFPSIHFGRVQGMFEHHPYSLPTRVAMALAQICCHNRALPIGAPTSPIVANMICAKMDSQLKELASRTHCNYSRYADDITFSTKRDRFPSGIALLDTSSQRWKIGSQVANIVKDNSFTVNESKTRFYSHGTRFEVTGLTVHDNRINVRHKLISQVRAMLHAWERYGAEEAEREFNAKYDVKQRLADHVDFKKVVRGKINFIAFIRGRDDAVSVKFLRQLAKLDSECQVRPITVSAQAIDRVLAQAIWLLEDEEGFQGTAFAAEGYGLLTAWHLAEHPTMQASQPWISPKTYPVAVERKSEDVDMAQLRIETTPMVQLQISSANNGVHVGDQITLAGFPHYHVGDSVHIARGPVTQERKYFGVQHFVIQPVIVKGNSGGPVLDKTNRVVGIAVKGLDTPGRFSEVDELSSFVPVSMLKELK